MGHGRFGLVIEGINFFGDQFQKFDEKKKIYMVNHCAGSDDDHSDGDLCEKHKP